jgi:hypothetical protein
VLATLILAEKTEIDLKLINLGEKICEGKMD